MLDAGYYRYSTYTLTPHDNAVTLLLPRLRHAEAAAAPRAATTLLRYSCYAAPIRYATLAALFRHR